MNPAAPEGRAVRAADDDSPGTSPSGVTPRDIVAQRLIAVPWRHAGLIALFALAGGFAATALRPHPAPARIAVAKPRVQAIQDAPSSSATGVELRLDLDPGAAAAAAGATRRADATSSSAATLRLDAAGWADEIDAVLRQAAPAAGRLLQASSGLAPAVGDEGRRPTLPGLLAGLLLGLLVAALRELGGERMRSPREAQWALGAPVLGTIPTLSAKARDAVVQAPAGEAA